MAFKKNEDTTKVMMNNKKVVASICPLESRGSKMLKAALNKKTPLKDRGSVATDEHSNVITIQQVAINRKRSPKNNVLFREPVVSQEFEYEQIYFDETHQNVHEQTPQNDHEDDKNTKHANTNTTSANNKTSPECLGTQSYEFGEVDDDGDLFTMAPSDTSEFSPDELKRQANGATKRLYRSIENDEQDAKQAGRDNSVGGGLFSSPKVAKIAPYFDERPYERRSAEARTINKNRLKSLQQRSLCTRRYTIKRSDSVLARTMGPLNTVPNDRVTDLTLSSYKRFSSPQICKQEPTIRPPTSQTPSPPKDETSCKSEANGYFSWIATFITNQMNKLIF